MNLVKWFRKNNTKVMAVVVCIIMIGFIGGAYLQQLAKRQSGRYDTVAYYLGDREILRNDLAIAQNELELLRALQADRLLRSQDVSRDITGALMAEVIFTDQQFSAQLIASISRTIRQQGYTITESQLADIYKRSAPGTLYWILLKNEARLAGVRIPINEAGQLLGRLIPQMTADQQGGNGVSYSQYISQLVQRHGVPENTILQVFADLLAVMQYTQIACSLEDVTVPQIRHMISARAQTMNAELVNLNARIFADDQNEPSDAEVQEQFDTYKDIFAGSITDENPYGFGYKLPERVKVEYIAIKMDDVAAAIEAPTQEEMEQYYLQNTEDFVDAVPIDPNDPNSPTKSVTKPFAEVMDEIDDAMRQARTNTLARDMMAEAATGTAPEFAGVDPEDATVEQIKEKAGDYQKMASKLTDEHNVKVYHGTTGLLDAKDVQQDQYLRRLYVRGNAGTPVPLARMMFAVEELKAGDLGPLVAARPHMYENLGPAIDMLGEVRVMLRVVEVREAAAPESVDTSYSVAGLQLGDPNDTDDAIVIKDQVVKDLKALAALPVAAEKATELQGLARAEGFAEAVSQFNEIYPKDPNSEDADPNNFRIDTIQDMSRITSQQMQEIAAHNAGNAAKGMVMRARNIERLFADKLYSLVPADSNSLSDPPVVMEFKPDMGYYVVNNLTVNRVYREDFRQIKASTLFTQEVKSSQSLAPVFLAPENIASRMKLRFVDEGDDEEADANEPNE